jgi:hypothetical protein
MGLTGGKKKNRSYVYWFVMLPQMMHLRSTAWTVTVGLSLISIFIGTVTAPHTEQNGSSGSIIIDILLNRTVFKTNSPENNII